MIMSQEQLRHPFQARRRFDGDNDDDLSSVASSASAEVNPMHIDKLMAKEIDRLSLKDRNAIYEEIHGVSTMALEETPELLEDSLRNFQAELDKINSNSKSAYDYIVNQEENKDLPCRRIVEDKDFRLRFLRTAYFDPAKAADRMVRFFELLQTLYGREALKTFDGSMNFYISDNSEQAGFRNGYLQLLPFRDRSGRKILVMVLDALELESITRFKIFLYMTFVAGEDIETQKNGLVMLFWPGCRELRLPNSSYRALVAKSFRCMPTRIVSFHFCFPATPFFRMVRAMISVTLKGGEGITRVKVHTGERMELQYQLMGFGIPVSLIPTTGTGTLKTKVFAQWVKARKSIESLRRKKGCEEEMALRIECPGVRDVIFRSVGKSCMLNPGNVTFRGIFEQYHAEHIQAGQTEKKNLVWKIVEEIESRNGRFLVWDKKGWWVPLDDRTEIRNKVATSLRGYNKQRKAEENRQHFKWSGSNVFLQQTESSKRRKLSLLCDESSDEDKSCGGCLRCLS